MVHYTQQASADPVPVTLAPPTNLIANAISSSEIDLSWTAPTNLGGVAISGYSVERSTDGGNTWQTVSSNTGNADTQYSDTGLFPNTTYTYRVSAITILVTSQPSNTATATTFGSPSNLTILSEDNNGIALPGFFTRLYLNGNWAGSGYTPFTYTLDSGQTYTVEIDTQYANYVFGRWQDTGSTSYARQISTTSDKTITAIYYTTPHPPTSLLASAASSSQINLTWASPSDNGGAIITGYKINRSADGGTTWITLVTNTGNTSTTYSDTGLAPNTVYTYRVFAINAIGTSTSSNTSHATTPTTVTAPQPPSGLAATSVSSTQINLSWSAPTDNGGSAITGYKIERSVDATWSVITSNTGTDSTSYSDTGLSPSTAYSYRVSAINAEGTGQSSNIATATTFSTVHVVTQIKSGLVASDSLTNETMTQQQLQASSRYWAFGGDAPDEGAPYDFFKDTRGLHIGSRAPANGTWAGYFAVSPNTNAVLFHSIVTTPVSSIPYQYYENGMYIQTSQPDVNYVTCASVTSQSGTAWAVVSTIGNATQANQFNVLYVDPSPNQPLTRDCTIITNGNNYLKVYLDGTMVYKSDTLNLQMPGPFNTYLEPQSSYTGNLLNGTYSDYYATSGESIQVINLPSNSARVDLVDSAGKVLSSTTVSSGIATLDVGKYHFPMSANIKAYDSSNTLVAMTSSMPKIYGGDIYSSH